MSGDHAVSAPNSACPVTSVSGDGTVGARTVVLSCPFDTATAEEALEQVLHWTVGDRTTHTVLTMNAALLVAMRSDEALATACRAGDLIVPDGVPVVWASRLLGTPLTERVTGVDLMTRILERGAEEGLRVYFLGAKPQTVAALAVLCRQRYPGLVVAGLRDGYFDQSSTSDVIDDIRASDAQILFIGMPSPFKETWSEEHREALRVPVVMGVGGSLDVLVGEIRRAPLIMQRVGLEWFWRLMMEPRKMWRRYLKTNTLFIALLGRALIDTRRNGTTEMRPIR